MGKGLVVDRSLAERFATDSLKRHLLVKAVRRFIRAGSDTSKQLGLAWMAGAGSPRDGIVGLCCARWGSRRKAIPTIFCNTPDLGLGIFTLPSLLSTGVREGRTHSTSKNLCLCYKKSTRLLTYFRNDLVEVERIDLNALVWERTGSPRLNGRGYRFTDPPSALGKSESSRSAESLRIHAVRNRE